MRLIFAATALAALALPAHAQRVDTRRIDIRETADNTMCGFTGFGDLTLIDASKAGNGKLARWSKAPEGAGADETARLELVFEPAEPGERAWRMPPILGLAFFADAGALPRNTVGGARLSVDGGPPVELQYTAGNKRLIAAAPDPEVAYGLIDDGLKIATVEFYDSHGEVLRRYTVDIHRLIDAVEVVSIVGWSCTSP